MKCLLHIKIFLYHYILIGFEGPGFGSEDWSISLASVKLMNANIFEYFSISCSLNDVDDDEKKLFGVDLTDSSSA